MAGVRAAGVRRLARFATGPDPGHANARHVTGLAAGFTVLLPVLSLLDLRPGPRLRRTAVAAGGGVCLVLVTLFGLFSGGERLGSQWPLGLLLTIVGALCGWLGAVAVPAARPTCPD